MQWFGMKNVFLGCLLAVSSAELVVAQKSAKASHILVKDEETVKQLQQEIAEGASFEKLAKKHSTCPSGKKGGDLGNFSQGQMVPEFDAVIFDPATKMGEVSDPVKTQFGFHLIKVFERKGVNGDEKFEKPEGGDDDEDEEKSAKASHILVDSEDKAKDLKAQIDGGADFAALAKEHSSCPSGQSGGDLGNFGEGMMVPEFDTVIFDPATKMGVVSDPVKTQFGYHLIKVFERNGVNGKERFEIDSGVGEVPSKDEL